MSTHTRSIPGLLVAVLLAVCGTGVRAADVQAAAKTLDERIEGSLATYREQAAKVADEKVPLLRQIAGIENENIALRERLKDTQRFTLENNRSFDALRNRLEGLTSQTEFAERFMQQYLDTFESRMHVAEDQHYKEALTAIRVALDNPTLTPSERFAKHLESVELGLTRAEGVIGGYQFMGTAIAPGGIVKRGTIGILGPTAYFSSAADDGDPVAGLLQFHSGTVEPAVAAFQAPFDENVRSFLHDKSGPLPLDASLGSAVLVQSANIRIADHIARGGPVGYAILILGAIALVLFLIKVYDLSRFKSVESRVLSDIIRTAREKNTEAALQRVRMVSGPVGEMLELGVKNINANRVLLEEMMLSVILRKRPEVERYLPFLAITAAAAPLLGLLGTVVGMIRTFALITVFGTSDPRALSAGISEALVTTELGLMVAIPTLVIHGVLSRMIKSRFGDMELVAFEFVKTIALEESRAKTN